VPAATIRELIALAKTKPGQMFYSSGAPAFHVSAELFKNRAGVNIVHVPYKGSGPAITAAIAGEVPMVVVSIVPVIAQLRAGKLRPLVVTSAQRDSLLPGVPTMSESGLDVEGGIWVGLFAPAGTPRAVVDKLYSEVSIILKSESTQKGLTTLGYDTSGTGMSPAEFNTFFRTNLVKWTKVIADLNISRKQLAKEPGKAAR
jgi:tripartite-type tricarboxylate transporter receptor subunit TctC